MRRWLTFGILLCQFCALAGGNIGTALPWSFEPLRKITPAGETGTTRIDRHVLAGLKSGGLRPAAPADRRVLLRRLYFDLVGLPPSAAAVREFQEDDRDDAFALRIEELLASPHYGERWARHWLDLARYTDKTASWLDSTASAWLYRDWVIQAFNDDVPYPVFVQRQLANDLLPNSNPTDNAALGFIGLSPTYWKELQLPPEIIKGTVADEWEERVDALGRTFLGLTLACARCHDHKTDPITTQDYYAVAGVFASVRLADRPTMSEELWAPVARARNEVKKLEAQEKALKKKKPEDLKKQLALLSTKISQIKKSTPHYEVPTANGIEDAALFVLPKTNAHGSMLDYRPGKARNLPVHKRGNPNVTGETVPRRFLSAFADSSGPTEVFKHGSGRLELAQAITDTAKPLVARVIVNRVWQHHFGRGLVTTPSEFGAQGDKPSHPELLDDLTARFVENGWSIKWLHREILLSQTWQQSASNPQAEARDPENRRLARMLRRRLDIESWRDTMLKVSGQLDPTVGGKSGELKDLKNHRRTIYGSIHRRDLDKMLTIHDFPDPAAHAASRNVTTSPLQQLFALNSPFVQQQSAELAKRLLSRADRRVHFAYELLFQRPPTDNEQTLAQAYLADAEDHPEKWTNYAQALLGSNEFLFVD